MYTQVHYHNSINSSSEWSNSNSLAFWSVGCPENFVLPTLKWGGVFWSTEAHSPRTGHEPQASHKYTHLGRNRGRSGDRGLHPPRLDPAQASATASEGPPAPGILGSWGVLWPPKPWMAWVPNEWCQVEGTHEIRRPSTSRTRNFSFVPDPWPTGGGQRKNLGSLV